jgi:alpha-amylase
MTWFAMTLESAIRLAYAFILTHQGYPCVFWQDYYAWALALVGEVSGSAALVRAHEDHAGGGHADPVCG